MYQCSGQGQRNHAIQCMAKILELGAEYSYLSDVLVDFVPFVESILCDQDNINVLRIAFLLTKNVSVSKWRLYNLKCYPPPSLGTLPVVCQLPVRDVPVQRKCSPISVEELQDEHEGGDEGKARCKINCSQYALTHRITAFSAKSLSISTW